MAESFDPYHRWLGIPPNEQPANHYRLLAISLFEADPEVIRDAAAQRMAHVRTYQLGPHSAISQKILNELGEAKACLLDPEGKAIYDQSLRARVPAAQESLLPEDLSADTVQSGPPVMVPPTQRGRRLPQRTLVAVGAAIGLLMLVGLVVWSLRSPGEAQVATSQTSEALEAPSVMARQTSGESTRAPQPQTAVLAIADPSAATKASESKPMPPPQEKAAARVQPELPAPAQPPQKQVQPAPAATDPNAAKTATSQEQKQSVPRKELGEIDRTKPPDKEAEIQKAMQGLTPAERQYVEADGKVASDMEPTSKTILNNVLVKGSLYKLYFRERPGYEYGVAWKVQQVINETEMLIHQTKDGAPYESLWIECASTAGFRRGSPFNLAWTVYVAGTKTYETILDGRRTVKHLVFIDPARVDPPLARVRDLKWFLAWKDSEGKVLFEAKLIGTNMKDGRVHFQKLDGEKISMNLADLSGECQKWVHADVKSSADAKRKADREKTARARAKLKKLHEGR